MSKIAYHINPETGRPNKCSAKIPENCKYAKDGVPPKHYDSSRQAQEDYEKTMNTAGVSKVSLTGATKNLRMPEDADSVASRKVFGDQKVFDHIPRFALGKGSVGSEKVHDETFVDDNGDTDTIRTYTATVNHVDPHEISEQFVKTFAKENTKNEDMLHAQDVAFEILKKNGLFEKENWKFEYSDNDGPMASAEAIQPRDNELMKKVIGDFTERIYGKRVQPEAAMDPWKESTIEEPEF